MATVSRPMFREVHPALAAILLLNPAVCIRIRVTESGTVNWLYQVVAGLGLDPDAPGYKRILIDPQPVSGLTYTKAMLDSMYGRVESKWIMFINITGIDKHMVNIHRRRHRLSF